MYRAAIRSAAPRIANPLRQPYVAASGRRFASTAPGDKKRSWKSSAARWGLAIGAVYWYSTSTAFAEEPKLKTIQPPPAFPDEDLPTVEAVIARKRQEIAARAQKAAAPESKTTPEPEAVALATQTSPKAPAKEIEANGEVPPEEGSPEAVALATQTSPKAPAKEIEANGEVPPEEGSPEAVALATQTSPKAPAKEIEANGEVPPEEGSPEALEQEAAQQGAFNPETGEINWDCPCLGGMAHGPCGEEFKAAFSCFVYSEEEPKGMDCIDKFQHMQDCFRLHPEVYSDELADDEEATPAEGVAARDASAEGAPATEPSTPAKESTKADEKTGEAKSEGEKSEGEKSEGEKSEGEKLEGEKSAQTSSSPTTKTPDANSTEAK